MTEPTTTVLPAFITRWQASGAAERANYQLFLSELCDALDLPRPDPTVDDDTANAYVFEKTVPLSYGTSGRIDLYRRGCFVLEAKQSSDHLQTQPTFSQQAAQQRQARKRGTAVRSSAAWDTAMEWAREQAQGYARNLPVSEIRDGRPPFLLVVDVGRPLALYAEFSRSGGSYIPFPDASDDQKARIRAIAEELDAHRKRQQARHPKLTLTDVYNVLEKLRAGAPLTARERTVHEQGLVSIVRQLHDDLDRAVCEAYGWPVTLGDEEILARLVALNTERAAEEAQGIVRWLRPAFQAPAAYRVTAQPALLREDLNEESRYVAGNPWPTRLAGQAQAVRRVLAQLGEPATAAQVAAAFSDAPVDRVTDLLETLASLGQAQQLDDERFVAS